MSCVYLIIVLGGNKMILGYGSEMKKDIVKMSSGWEEEIFLTIQDNKKSSEIVYFILDELLKYVDNNCSLGENKNGK